MALYLTSILRTPTNSLLPAYGSKCRPFTSSFIPQSKHRNMMNQTQIQKPIVSWMIPSVIIITIFVLGTRRWEIALSILCPAHSKLTGQTHRALWTLWIWWVPAARSTQWGLIVGVSILMLMIIGVGTPHHVNQFIRCFTIWYGKRLRRCGWRTRIIVLENKRSRVFLWAFCKVTGNQCGAWANSLHIIPTYIKICHCTRPPKFDCSNIIGFRSFFLCACVVTKLLFLVHLNRRWQTDHTWRLNELYS